MTSEQTNNIYTKKLLKNNKEFLKWIKQNIKEGYKPFLSIEELQDLIDTMTIWYELKYPEKYFDLKDGILYDDFENLKNITNQLTFEQLLFRLNNNQITLLNSEYTSCMSGNMCVYDENYNVKDFIYEITIIIQKNIKKYNELNDYYIYVNPKTGQLYNNYDLEKLTNKKQINVEELYNDLKNNKDLDITSLERCIKDHKIDTEIRNYVFKCV